MVAVWRHCEQLSTAFPPVDHPIATQDQALWTRLVIDICCGLVHKEDVCPGQECPRETHQLALHHGVPNVSTCAEQNSFQPMAI
jgi:hypothetical protein